MIIHAGFNYCLMGQVVPQINNVNSASNLRAMNANRRSFNDTRVMWVFGRLTSVRPLCTRTRTTGRGWIWPAGGCSLQPGRELRQREEGLSLRPLASTWAQASAESQRRERARDATEGITSSAGRLSTLHDKVFPRRPWSGSTRCGWAVRETFWKH